MTFAIKLRTGQVPRTTFFWRSHFTLVNVIVKTLLNENILCFFTLNNFTWLTDYLYDANSNIMKISWTYLLPHFHWLT